MKSCWRLLVTVLFVSMCVPRRTTHDVPVAKIRHMLDNYERFVTIKSIMGSRMPEMKQRLLLEDSGSQ